MRYKILESEFPAQIGTVVELTDRQAEVFPGKIELIDIASVMPPVEPVVPPVETAPVVPEVPPVVTGTPPAPVIPESVKASWVGGHTVNAGVLNGLRGKKK